MSRTMHPSTDGPSANASRRHFLKSAAAFTIAAPALVRAQTSRAASAQKPLFAYVGSYSSPQGPEGSKGNGQGIYLFHMDAVTGALSQVEVFRSDSNPSWIALDPSGTHLYSANETPTFEGASTGSLSAYAIDRTSGGLRLLNTVSSQGAGPAHLSVHPSGKFVLVANYAGGTVAVLPIKENGELGPATDVQRDQGEVGPTQASDAPRGSFAISGHDRPHAHMIQADAEGRYVLASDLGMDRIFNWKFDAQNGKLSPSNPASTPLPPGSGPRHFVFHANGRWLYSLQEEDSTVVVFDYDAATGKSAARQTVSTLPEGFAGTNFTSEIRISPDGKFLYVADRLHDSIAWFSIGERGGLTRAGEEWTRGDYPRSFTIDPTGEFLYSCNQRSDAVTTFRVNRQTGGLTFTGQYTPIGTPAIIVFLT